VRIDRRRLEDPAGLAREVRRLVPGGADVAEQVAGILAAVAAGGDAALIEHTARFDVAGHPLRVTADELATAATVAVGLAKLLVHRGLTTDLEHQLADEALAIELSSRSDDFKEHGKARKERRDPDFTGR